MPKFAVGWINFFDNDLKIEIIEAETWKEALVHHSSIVPDRTSWADQISDDIEETKEMVFDCDCMFDVVEVK